MDEVYVTLNEAAELEGVGYDTFQKKVRRNPEKYSAKMDQRDGGGRDMVFILVDSLSKKARDAYAERERVKEFAEGAGDNADEEAHTEVPWYVNEDVDYYMEHHKDAWYRAMELGNVVRQFLEYSSKGRTNYAEKIAREQTGKGIRTFYRYVKAYQEAAAWAYRLEKQDGCNYDHLKVLALCRKPKESGTFPSFKPEVKQAIKNIWFNKEFAANQGTREMLYDKLTQLAAINHWEKIPSYQSVVRYISYLMNEGGMKNAWYLASHGEREYKNKVMGKALRDATVLMPMEMVMGDEHTFDCWVSYTYPNGKSVPIRPVLVAWIDVRSRRLLGDVICHHANSDILKESVIKMINTPGCGVPKYLLIDNGKDYTAKAMTGVPRTVRNTKDSDYVDVTGGFYYKLGIEDVHRALPYQPWTKTQVERFFGGVCSRFTKWMGSYVGTLTGSKTDAKIPKDIQKMHDRGELLTMEEFYEKWQEWLHTKYETHVHRGLKDAGEKWTKPIELFENEERYYKPAPPRSAQITFMYREDNVHIYNYGFRRFGNVYDAPELRLYTGETLSIRYDKNDVSHIFVLDSDGKQVCTAECKELLAFGEHVSEELLLKHIKEQNRQLREDRGILRDANVPFEEMYSQYVGFSSYVGGVDGVYSVVFSSLGETAGNHPNELVFEALKNGFKENCYDKKPFFSENHPSGEGGKTFASNMSHEKLSAEAYKKARANMMCLTGDKGKSLNLVPNLLVVSPANEETARLILKADQINGTSNVLKDTAELLVTTELADKPNYWFLMCTNKFLKPLIFQQRKKAQLVSKTRLDDDNVFMRDEFLWGADTRSNAGYGFWQMAFGSDGIAEG